LQWVKQNYNQLLQKFGQICLYIWFGTSDFTVKRGKYIFLHQNLAAAVETVKRGKYIFLHQNLVAL
jgi:hypothetical protein